MARRPQKLKCGWKISISGFYEGLDFQYGGRLFFKNGSSYISAINWDMSTKFGLLIDFDLLKAAMSTDAKIKTKILLKRYDVQIEAILFPVSYLLTSLPSEVKVYEQTKFRRHISIDGWDITTSVFEKQTSAILEIYFRFRFRPFARNLHIILHQATEFFSKSKHPLRKYDVISISQDGGRDGWILLPVSYLLMPLPSEGHTVKVY